MSFSAEWEDCYRANRQMSVWPWSDLISYVMRYAKPRSTGAKILELGCGAGANIPFFLSLPGVEYFGIDGSETVIRELKQRFREVSDNLVCGDFTAELPWAGPFDLVVDRSSLTHNSTAAIRHCLSQVHARLIPGGAFVGIDWFSTEHSAFMRGVEMDDPYTRANFSEGQFAGVGKVHFSDKAHLIDLLAGFEIVVMAHKIVSQEIPNLGEKFAAWQFVARKAAT